MSTFGVLMSTDGAAFVRLAEGDWLRLQPGQIIWVDLHGVTVTQDGPDAQREIVEPELAARLEVDLQRQRIETERRAAGL